jgi:hypothetical protein
MGFVRTYGWSNVRKGNTTQAHAGLKIGGMKVPVIKVTPASAVKGKAAPKARRK